MNKRTSLLVWIRILTVLPVFVAAMSATARGQLNYAGKDFWLTLAGHISSFNSGPFGVIQDGTFIFSSKHHASIRLFYTSTGVSRRIEITPDSAFILVLNKQELNSLANTEIEKVQNNSLHIISDSNITVCFIANEITADDGMMLLPSDEQKPADLYYLFSVSARMASSVTCNFSIVANCDSTVLEIIPAINTYSKEANVPYQITLNEGETFQIGTKIIRTADENQDLSGTSVKILHGKARNPINVFCVYPSIDVVRDHNKAYPERFIAADKLLEQLLPVNWWDTIYPIVAFYRHDVALYRIMSSVDDNDIYFDNNLVTTLGKGQVLDTCFFGGVVVHSEHPIAILEFPLAESADTIEENGDGDMLWNMSWNQRIKEAVFTSLGFTTVVNHALTVISRSDNVGSVKFDGASVNGYFKNFPGNPDWQYAYIPVTPVVTHHITSDSGVLAYIVHNYRVGGYSFNLSDLIKHKTVLHDTITVCKSPDYKLSASPATAYLWGNGDTSRVITVFDTDRYTVSEINVITEGCQSNTIDTVFHEFYLVIKPSPVEAASDIVTCINHAVKLNAEVKLPVGSYTIKWQPAGLLDSDTIPGPTVYAAGKDVIFTVAVFPDDSSYCIGYDTINVAVLQGFTLLTGDTSVCRGDTVIMRISGDKRYNYTWSPEPLNKDIFSFVPAGDTVYTVTASYPGCRDSIASVKVDVFDVPAVDAGADATICFGDTLQLHGVVTPSGNYNYRWFPESAFDYGNTLDPVFMGKLTEKVILKVTTDIGCEVFDTTTIAVTYPPVLDLGPDRMMCPYSAEVEKLENLTGDVLLGNYSWNTGATTDAIEIRHPGTYWLTLSIGSRCWVSDTVEIYKSCYLDIPNVFTPNGDGLNDFFMVRQLQTNRLKQLSMDIYDRWGNKVFYTTNIEGRGWDGRFNGESQPQGVYILLLEAAFINEGSERYQGNITLIR